MNIERGWAAVGVAVAVLAGCTSTAVRIGPKPREGYEVLGKTSGGACGLNLFGVIPIGVNSRTERAYADAVRRGGGLMDAELQTQWWVIPAAGVLLCTRVQGTEVR
jgi:hypothetical protein